MRGVTARAVSAETPGGRFAGDRSRAGGGDHGGGLPRRARITASAGADVQGATTAPSEVAGVMQVLAGFAWSWRAAADPLTRPA